MFNQKLIDIKQLYFNVYLKSFFYKSIFKFNKLIFNLIKLILYYIVFYFYNLCTNNLQYKNKIDNKRNPKKLGQKKKDKIYIKNMTSNENLFYNIT